MARIPSPGGTALTSTDGIPLFQPVVRLVRRYVPQGQLTRGVLVLVFGTVAAQGILVLTSPLLTRLYDPADLGSLSVYTAILSVLLTITCLSYELAVPLPENETDAANTLTLSILVNLLMSVLAGLVLLVAGPAITSLLGVANIGPVIAIVAIGQSVGGIHIALNTWAIRMRRFTAISGVHVFQAGTLSATQLGLGLLAARAVGLMVADIASRAVAALALAVDARRHDGPVLRTATLRGVRAMAVRYRRFAILSTPSSLINTLGLQAPTLLVVGLYGTSVGGQLFLAQRVAALPVTLLARSVGQVYTSEAARVAREDPSRMRGLFLQTTKSLGRAGIGPTIALAILAPLLFPPVFGAEWAQAGWFTAILAPMYLLTLVTSPTGATLDVLERQDLHLIRETTRLFLVGGAVVLASALALPPVGAILLLSAAGCLTYCWYGLLSFQAIRERERKVLAAGRS